MYSYYLKKCGSQELGSVAAGGRPQRGRYLLISMNPHILSFFPPLSETQLNDFSPVALIPLYQENVRCYCNYVYHNDKFHGSTAQHPRNEHRLYLSRELERDNDFQAGDIIIFRKENQEQPNSPLYIDRITHAERALYDHYNRIIENYPVRGGHAVFCGTIPEFEAKIMPNTVQEEIFIDQRVTDDLTNTTEQTVPNIADRFTSVMFRDFLISAYVGLCAITRVVIRHNDLMNIEAAHIRPRAHEGTFMPNNGLMLSRDLHWAFDKGFFTITEEYNILVHPDVRSDYLNNFNGRTIFIPENPFFQPSRDNLLWHRNNIFGQFRNIQAIEEQQ